MINTKASTRLLTQFAEIMSKEFFDLTNLKKGAFFRSRTFPLEVILFSFVLDAQQGFTYGVRRLIATLFELEIVKENKGRLPSKTSYNEACAKLSADVVHQQLKKSHHCEYETNGDTFHGLKVLIPDGTMVSLSNTAVTPTFRATG